MNDQAQGARVWEETILIPTYGVGEPDKNPLFLERRVYQGSSGKVYPYKVIDKICDEKTDKAYHAVFLENEYLRITVLPELGGRIYRALDKTNGYDFVYHNEVVKPALVGLLGPWISGGIEFNWPQHHRPTTFMPVDWRIFSDADGASVEMSETDQMYGTKCALTITLRPGRAYIEVSARLYNGTDFSQTFLWWANPAVAVNDYTYSVFPPDVTAVYDHGKRDVSKFPIADGVYYKHDYSAGVDISRYKNIPVPTSYMCARSDYDFVGGYDERAQAGLLHIADHHVSPGKKQWTWGCGDFGRAWDDNLTDANGPYIELMTGVYCDNQPDFAWLAPHEEKSFTQYFMPYKTIGRVKNASRNAAVNLEVSRGKATFSVYATGAFDNARVTLTRDGEEIYDKTVTLSPTDIWVDAVPTDAPDTALTLIVRDQYGKALIAYTPIGERDEQPPEPMPAAKSPQDIPTTEELCLTGLHIEQYRHATYRPEDYYLEGLKRDAGDSRLNVAYGSLLLRRGLFAESERYFLAAIARMTLRNPNPPDDEAHVLLGLSYLYRGLDDLAYDAFFKAAWTAARANEAYFHIARLDMKRGEWQKALEHVEKSLMRNARDTKARALKGVALRKLGRDGEARAWNGESLSVDAFDCVSRLEWGDADGVVKLMGERDTSYIECALQYAAMGQWRRAVSALDLSPKPSRVNRYHKALCAARYDQALSDATLTEALSAPMPECYPNRLEDIATLDYAMHHSPNDARAPYLLGCLWYDKRRYDDAIALWERSAQLDGAFPTAWRNLAIAYFNKRGDAARALDCMERAYHLDESDARVLYELDCLRKRMNAPIRERLKFLEARESVAVSRDDLYTEYITLLNTIGRHEDALRHTLSHRFHPWEGGEGRITGQYAIALTEMARQKLADGDAVGAKALLERALTFPRSLGEGKLEGAKDNNIRYYLGLAERALGDERAAARHFAQATEGDEQPSVALYYNDQPADMIYYQGLACRALGDETRARARFQTLIDYGQSHRDDATGDFFAVSLPDLQLFEDDLSRRNNVECDYLAALGYAGLGDTVRAETLLRGVLREDAAHQRAALHLKTLSEGRHEHL